MVEEIKSNSSSDSSSECEIDPRYENGKIYQVVCKITGRIYIGSTIETLEDRLYKHENDYKRYIEEKFHYISVYDILEDKKYFIELIKDYPCSNKKELEREEGRHQLVALADDNVNCVNRNIAGRTKEEKLAFKRDKFTCPCGGKYTRSGKSSHFKTKKHLKYLKQKEVVENMMREVITEIVNNAISNL